MLKGFCHKRLERDLDRWIAAGWVPPGSRARILEDAGEGGGASFAALLGILGAVLFSAGVLTFVAANWEAMSRLSRVGLLAGGLWAALLAGAWLKREGHAWLARGLWLIALAIYGGSIMLVSQMYHIHGNFPDGVMLWAFGALFAAALLGSQTLLVAAIALLAFWDWTVLSQYSQPQPHWGFVIPWAVALGLALWRRQAWAVNLAVLAGFMWAVPNLGLWWDGRFDARTIISFMIQLSMAGFICGVLAAAGGWPRAAMLARPLRLYGGLGMLGGFFLLQVVPAIGFSTRAFAVSSWWLAGMAGLLALLAVAWLRGRLRLPDVLVLGGAAAWSLVAWIWHPSAPHGWRVPAAVVVLGLAVWMIAFGRRRQAAGLYWGGFAAFAAEVLYLYFVTLGNLLDTSVFMLVGGVVFIALGWVLVRLARNGRGRAA